MLDREEHRDAQGHMGIAQPVPARVPTIPVVADVPRYTPGLDVRERETCDGPPRL